MSTENTDANRGAAITEMLKTGRTFREEDMLPGDRIQRDLRGHVGWPDCAGAAEQVWWAVTGHGAPPLPPDWHS